MTDADQARRTIDQCRDIVDALKFGYPLILTAGLAFMLDVKREFGLSIVADMKIADVPVTNSLLVRMVSSHGGDAVMVHGFVGSDSIIECVRVGAPACSVIVVTELTSPGGVEFTGPHAVDFASLARDLGCPAIQAPGTRPERVTMLRGVVGPEMEIVCCGIGAQGGQLGAVLRAGADYGIIGRAIWAQPSPREAALRFQEESDEWKCK